MVQLDGESLTCITWGVIPDYIASSSTAFFYSFVGLGLFFMLARHLALSFATSPCPLGESGMAFCIEWDPELSSPYAGAFGKHYRLYSRRYCPSFEALHPQTASTSLLVRIFFWALWPLHFLFSSLLLVGALLDPPTILIYIVWLNLKPPERLPKSINLVSPTNNNRHWN